MAVKVVVVVSGGNVQDCYADSPHIEIEIIDFDNIADAGPQAVRDANEQVERISETMVAIY